jgi:DNA ligase-1
MKQGSIMNFINKKNDSSSAPTELKSETKVKKESTSPVKVDSNKQTKPSPKKKDSPSKTKSAKVKVDTPNKKRRHIVDDNEEDIEKEEELATDLLISTKGAKQEEESLLENEIKPQKDSIPFETLVKALNKIEVTKGEGSKDIMKETLSELFKDIILNSPDDLPRAYYFLLSKVGPEYRNPEMGIGTGILEKVVGKSIGKSDKHIKERMKILGDLALVASEGKKTLGTMEKYSGFTNISSRKALDLKNVMDIFIELSNIKGKSSMAEKERLLVKLLFSANKDEIKYIVRSLQKGLKIGASFKTIIAALSRAISKIYNESNLNTSPKKGTKKEILEEKVAEKALLIAINNISDEDIVFDHVIKVIKRNQDFNDIINLCKIRPGCPVKPQLARPTNGVKVVLERFDDVPFTCEYKYDGFRGQVHHYETENGFKTEIFSRNLENMSESYPDIIQYVETIHSDKVKSFILDCEIVAFDTKTGKILPFHNLTTRARKNVNVKEISTNVCMFLFDIIYLNNKCVCELSLDDRRKLLKENFEENNNIQFAKFVSSDKVEEIEGFMNEAIQAGTEGLIIKALHQNSEYMPGQRNFNWLKLKKDYLETSTGDSLDLVPIGAELGKGKRKGMYGTFLLACYDEDSEKFQTVTMTGSGLKDGDLEHFYNELSQHVIEGPRADYDVGKTEIDIWFDAKIVWEIKTADLTQSPIYTAAQSMAPGNRGISLRFPRFIRSRPDKKPEEATSSEEILKMFTDQEKSTKKINFNEEEFYD